MAWLAAAGGASAAGAGASGAAAGTTAAGTAANAGIASATSATACGTTGLAAQSAVPATMSKAANSGMGGGEGAGDFFNGARMLWGGNPMSQSTTDTLNYMKPPGKNQMSWEEQQAASENQLQQWLGWMGGN